MGYAATTNRPAKAFYSLSVIWCSSLAITSVGVLVLARTYKISETATSSKACAIASIILGNKANVQAPELESEPISPHLNAYVQKGLRRSLYSNNGLGFVMPSGINYIVWSEVIERIPFETIEKFIGIGLSIYNYSKLIIVSYQYSEQFFSKFKARRQSLLLIKQIRFVAVHLSLRVHFFRYYESSA